MIACAECAFWYQEENSNFGQCRRKAPQPKMMTTGTAAFIGPYNARAIWPYTRDIDGCAEGKKGEPGSSFELKDQTKIGEQRKSPDSFNVMVERAKRG